MTNRSKYEDSKLSGYDYVELNMHQLLRLGAHKFLMNSIRVTSPFSLW